MQLTVPKAMISLHCYAANEEGGTIKVFDYSLRIINNIQSNLVVFFFQKTHAILISEYASKMRRLNDSLDFMKLVANIFMNIFEAHETRDL